MPFSLLDLLFPKRSLSGMEGDWVTERECSLLFTSPLWIERNELHRKGVYFVDRLFAAGSYHDCSYLRTAIRSLKYGRRPGVGEILAKLFVERLAQEMLFSSAVITPVPLHWSRRFVRGFNQAGVFATAVSNAYGLSSVSLLRRCRATGFQSHRSKDERLHAVRGAFRISRLFPSHSPPALVYLVDDVFTTGATMDECAQVLKKAGVRAVIGLVLARG